MLTFDSGCPTECVGSLSLSLYIYVCLYYVVSRVLSFLVFAVVSRGVGGGDGGRVCVCLCNNNTAQTDVRRSAASSIELSIAPKTKHCSHCYDALRKPELVPLRTPRGAHCTFFAKSTPGVFSKIDGRSFEKKASSPGETTPRGVVSLPLSLFGEHGYQYTHKQHKTGTYSSVVLEPTMSGLNNIQDKAFKKHKRGNGGSLRRSLPGTDPSPDNTVDANPAHFLPTPLRAPTICLVK